MFILQVFCENLCGVKEVYYEWHLLLQGLLAFCFLLLKTIGTIGKCGYTQSYETN